MSRLQFINNEIGIKTSKSVIRKSLPGFKFAIGDRVRLIKDPGEGGGWYCLEDMDSPVPKGTILTIRECGKSKIEKQNVYGFVEESGEYSKYPNWLHVEQNFELVEEKKFPDWVKKLPSNNRE